MPNMDVQTDWFTQLITSWVSTTPTVAVLLVLMGLDILSGILAAIKTRQLSSSASASGMLKKIMFLVLVAVGLLMETIYDGIPWGRIFAMFFCFTEIISITENAARAGVPLPPQLVEALKNMKSEGKKQSSMLGDLTINQVKIDHANVTASDSKDDKTPPKPVSTK